MTDQRWTWVGPIHGLGWVEFFLAIVVAWVRWVWVPTTAHFYF